MKVFIWDYVANLTNAYHSSGGLVVVAASLDDARVLIKNATIDNDNDVPYSQRIDDDCKALTEPPARTYDTTEDAAPEVFVFPNAGCC